MRDTSVFNICCLGLVRSKLAQQEDVSTSPYSMAMGMVMMMMMTIWLIIMAAESDCE